MLARIAPVVAIALVGPSCIGPFGACTLIGCGPIASAELLTIIDDATLTGATLELCIEQSCVISTLPAPPAMVGQGVQQEMTGDFSAYVVVWRTDTGTRLVIELNHAERLADGDVYSAVLSNNGTTLAEQSWTASYERTYPNGRSCDDGCLSATLTPR